MLAAPERRRASPHRVVAPPTPRLAKRLAVPPAPLAPGRVNHVALPTADPVAGARFYVETLGFRETERPGFSFRGSWLWRPEAGLMIHLIHDESHRPPTGPINTRTHHLALETPDYDQAIAQLRAHGVEFVERVLPDYGYRQAFFRDPDGNVLELGEWPPPEVMLGEESVGDGR